MFDHLTITRHYVGLPAEYAAMEIPVSADNEVCVMSWRRGPTDTYCGHYYTSRYSGERAWGGLGFKTEGTR